MNSTDYFSLLTKSEPLLPELRDYYDKGTVFEMIRHPLVFAVPYSPQQNALLNRRLEEKKIMAERMIAYKEWDSFFFLHERPYRLNAFTEIEEYMTDSQYWKLLGEIWIDSENIWQNKPIWLDLLRSKRREKDEFMDSDSLKKYKSLPAMVTAYRGHQTKNKTGISYTLNKKKAEWFSTRLSKSGKVEAVTVHKKKIFAYLGGRNEQEVIILP